VGALCAFLGDDSGAARGGVGGRISYTP